MIVGCRAPVLIARSAARSSGLTIYLGHSKNQLRTQVKYGQYFRNRSDTTKPSGNTTSVSLLLLLAGAAGGGLILHRLSLPGVGLGLAWLARSGAAVHEIRSHVLDPVSIRYRPPVGKRCRNAS
jgi:hypothetical protein